MQLDNWSNLVQKALILLLNFVDDIAIFGLTRLGLHWAWLQWLSTILLVVTVAYWTIRLWRYYRRVRCL
ncbi:MAG: hypothetical protein AAF572_05510 [Cyanobacteria bacterium P01_B01_bin.77]